MLCFGFVLNLCPYDSGHKIDMTEKEKRKHYTVSFVDRAIIRNRLLSHTWNREKADSF